MKLTTKIPLWVLIEDGIIVDSIRTQTPQPNYIELPRTAFVHVGEPAIWYNDNGRRIPDDELVKKGLRKDNRGMYWLKKNYHQVFFIMDLDVPIPEYVTKLKPLAEINFQKFENGKWVKDTKAEYRDGLQIEHDALQIELDNTDWIIVRAAEQGQIISETNPKLHETRKSWRKRITEIRNILN